MDKVGRLGLMAVVAMLLGGALEPASLAQQLPSGGTPAVQRQLSGFDPEVATEAYLARLTPDQRSRSDRYFEGGYWLTVWNFLYGAAVALLLLATKLSVKMRDLAVRITRRPNLQTLLYWVQYLVLTSVLAFPLTVYQEFFREHAYGLSTQSFGPWLGDQGKGLLVGAVLGALAMMGVYAAVRRAQRTWWLWAAGISVAFLAFAAVIAPVFITPLFNTYTPLADPGVREPILRLARANGVPATEVFVFDASKQTTRISANVSGFLGTDRISLNDNLLNRCSLPEIEAVMAHEIGHYALHHTTELILQFGLLIVAGFALLRLAFDKVCARWGERWGIGGVADVAALPLMIFLLSAFFFLATPISNTIIRSNEVEADIFALNAARQPEGFAEASLKLAEYRKLAPGPLEEFLFFDHPSGRSRILMAMRWKAENLPPVLDAPLPQIGRKP